MPKQKPLRRVHLVTTDEEEAEAEAAIRKEGLIVGKGEVTIIRLCPLLKADMQGNQQL